MNLIEELKSKIESIFSLSVSKIAPPLNPDGIWHWDLRGTLNTIVVEWRPGRGFGISTIDPKADPMEGYGEGADEVVPSIEAAMARISHLLTTGEPTKNIPKIEEQIRHTYNIAADQIYRDNDRRHPGRRLRVLGVATKPDKATCATVNGGRLGATLYISFRRLANKRLYTLESNERI